MKRSLLVLALVVIVAAPTFAQDLAGATAVSLPCFGWGVAVPGCGVLLGIPGDDYEGCCAFQRATIIAARIAGLSDDLKASTCGSLYLAKVCGDKDYAIVLETVADGELVKTEIVTIDARTAKAYGACTKQLGTFWLNRLHACILKAQAVPCMCWPKMVMKAAAANWKCWKGNCMMTVCCED